MRKVILISNSHASIGITCIFFFHQRVAALFVLTALSIMIGFVSFFETQLMETFLNILV